MAVTLMNPEGLPQIDAYQQVAIASGTKLVYIAGQVSWDAEGRNVGEGDLAAQVEQAYLNAVTALKAAGGALDDLVKLTFYVVDWTPDKMPLFMEGMGRAAAQLGGLSSPPASLIGVAALDVPEHLVELEAVAVLD